MVWDLESTKSVFVSINNTPPHGRITSLEDGDNYSIESYNVFPLNAEVSDTESPESDLKIEWRVDLHHDNHFHYGPTDPNSNSFAILEALGCGFESYWYRVHLTVTDPEGLSYHEEANLYPYCGDPVCTFIEFEGRPDDTAIVLDWEVSNDDDLAYFIIEKTDEYLFQDMVNVTALQGESTYSVKDNSPFLGPNFYRLKAYNNKGEFNYSEIIRLEYYPEHFFQIRPNPAEDEVTIHFQTSTPGIAEFDLYTLDGQKVLSSKHQSQAGESTIIKQISHLTRGLYIYKYKFNDHQFQGRLLKM